MILVGTLCTLKDERTVQHGFVALQPIGYNTEGGTVQVVTSLRVPFNVTHRVPDAVTSEMSDEGAAELHQELGRRKHERSKDAQHDAA